METDNLYEQVVVIYEKLIKILIQNNFSVCFMVKLCLKVKNMYASKIPNKH